MVHLPAAVVAAIVAIGKASLTTKLTLGSAALCMVVIKLNFRTVYKRARAYSPHRIGVRRESDGDRIRIVLEASGRPAVWLTDRLDRLLQELLPTDGARATI